MASNVVHINSLQQMEDLAQQNKLLLRVNEACKLTGISRSLGYKMINSGEWPVIKVGGKAVRIPLEELKNWIDSKLKSKN